MSPDTLLDNLAATTAELARVRVHWEHLIGECRDVGLSLRAIEPAAGVSKNTVDRIANS